jgi:hypothetical protein
MIIFFGNGSGELGDMTFAAAGNASWIRSPSIADFNNDGLPDIVTANAEPDHSASVLLNRPPEQSRLAILPPEFDGRLVLTVDGQPGIDLRIESSTDLREWVPHIALPNASGKTQFIDLGKPPYNKRFFRAVDP